MRNINIRIIINSLILIFATSLQVLNAQDDFLNGYVLLKSGDKKTGMIQAFHCYSKSIKLQNEETALLTKFERDDISEIGIISDSDTLIFTRQTLYELEGKRLIKINNSRWVAKWYGSDELQVYCVYWEYSKMAVGAAAGIPFVIPRGKEYHVLQALKFKDTDKLILINLLNAIGPQTALNKMMKKLFSKHCPILKESWKKNELSGQEIKSYVDYYIQNCNR